jgi:hypothetical protein
LAQAAAALAGELARRAYGQEGDGVDLDLRVQQRARDLHGGACSNAGDNYYAGDFGSSPRLRRGAFDNGTYGARTAR